MANELTGPPLSTRHAPNAMVASVDHLASSAGLFLLRAGGTAADAAVGMSAVLAVTTQHMCGMGGDLFALVHSQPGPPEILNASGRAGSGADPDRMRGEGASVMASRGDIRSVPVPGCVDGWMALHERHGRLPLTDVLRPAISYAADGFPVSPTLAASIPAISEVPGADDYQSSRPLVPGDRIRRPRLATALADIAEGGRQAWYEGAFGAGLIALGSGEYDEADLARSQAEWVAALGISVWGHDLWTVPPNSQGYLTLASAWIAEGLDLPEGPEGPDDPLWAHLLIEASRQAGHDRLAVLHEGADGADLIAPGRLEPRQRVIEPDRAQPLDDTGYRDGGTIHLAAVDAEGMGVSLIQSNAGGWGAHLVVPEVGVFLQNRGVGFSLQAGHPAEYGPRRRPPHTLAPALVTRRDGGLAAVIGTMGGDSQPQIILQLLARIIGPGNQTPGPAVGAGRFVLSGGGSGFDTWDDLGAQRVRIEGHCPDGWAEGLAQRGHRVEMAPAHSAGFGHAHVIAVVEGGLAGASDPRPRTGAAMGY